jgi:hypothetical protein
MWPSVPLPGWPKFSLPGLALAAAISSLSVDTPPDLPTIERHRLVHQLVQRQRRRRREKQCVAVGLGLRDIGRADIAARPRLVFDDHRLAELLGESLADFTRNQVGIAAGRERHHHSDRAARPGVLGNGVSARQRQQR